MKSAIDILEPLVTSNLPDSIRQRKEVLAALLILLPKKHIKRDAIFSMLTLLETHEALQRDLPGLFPEPKIIGHDGHKKGDGL